MDKQEEAVVRKMSFQQRLSHFGPLLANGTIKWNEYAYIIRKIPYENNRRLENMKVNETSSEIRTNVGEQRLELVGPESVPVRGLLHAERATEQEQNTSEVERADRLPSRGSTDGKSDGQGGTKDDAFEEKVSKIRENILSG